MKKKQLENNEEFMEIQNTSTKVKNKSKECKKKSRNIERKDQTQITQGKKW